ncbi:MAG: hypothetical protein EBX72_09215, partial [Betaproteobacteria bacterium]|nr:hypothetical protein [Betaproteobacteria bacterium]
SPAACWANALGSAASARADPIMQRPKACLIAGQNVGLELARAAFRPADCLLFMDPSLHHVFDGPRPKVAPNRGDDRLPLQRSRNLDGGRRRKPAGF